jgi:hypothetical protein
MQKENEMSGPCSGIMHDDTLTPDERLQLIEALFVHDAVGPWRDRRADVSHIPQASRLTPRASSTRSRPRDGAGASRH